MISTNAQSCSTDNGVQITKTETEITKIINSLTTIGYLLDAFIKLWILLLEASTGNLSQSFINPFSVGSRPWTHPLISERSIVKALRPQNAPLD